MRTYFQCFVRWSSRSVVIAKLIVNIEPRLFSCLDRRLFSITFYYYENYKHHLIILIQNNESGKVIAYLCFWEKSIIKSMFKNRSNWSRIWEKSLSFLSYTHYFFFQLFFINKRVENVPENVFFIIGFQLLGQGIVS